MTNGAFGRYDKRDKFRLNDINIAIAGKEQRSGKMAIEQVRSFFESRNLDYEIIEMPSSTATVALAAAALGVEEARIAKSLALRQKEGDAVIVVCGTARLDNKKYKSVFSCKAKMLSVEETLEVTEHPVGGVCPFGLPSGVSVYLDVSLRRFSHIFPAAGGTNTAVKMTPDELHAVTGGTWVDICEGNE